MKFFENIQKHYAILGISPSQQSTQKCLCNERIFFGFLLFGWLIFLHFMYIFYVANDLMEYIESICVTSACIIIFSCFATIVLRKTTLFEIIDNMEKLIDTREKIFKISYNFLLEEY